MASSNLRGTFELKVDDKYTICMDEILKQEKGSWKNNIRNCSNRILNFAQKILEKYQKKLNRTSYVHYLQWSPLFYIKIHPPFFFSFMFSHDLAKDTRKLPNVSKMFSNANKNEVMCFTRFWASFCVWKGFRFNLLVIPWIYNSHKWNVKMLLL